MKVTVDRALCIGITNCVAFAPTVFQMDKENKAIVLDPKSVPLKKLLEAAESCPQNAITVEDDNGRELYP